MQKYDNTYSDYHDDGDPDGYPYGKARDASGPESVDGTPIKASFFNDVIGMMQAIQKGASPEGTSITGRPERVSESDVWDALRGFIERAVHRVLKLVPSEATEENQLADKRFVDDAVSTNSAYFVGNFNSVGELPTEGVTNNDYAYVKRTVGDITYTDRYKYNGRKAAWEFEYTLDNTTVPIATAARAGLVKGGGNVAIASDGTMSVDTASTPPDASNTTDIATTAWVRKTLNGAIAGHISVTASNLSGANKYIKYSNGLIIQWGRFYGSGIRLGISFSNTDYIVVDAIYNASSNVLPADYLRPLSEGYIEAGAPSFFAYHQWIAIGI